jgi:hypothetical protein
MKYALLIYVDPSAGNGLSDEAQSAVTAEYMAIRDEPACIAGGHLQSPETATTIRVSDGQTLTTDGPFADTKEVFGGYYVFDVDNLDRAIEVAARIPAARSGGSVEVRPLVEY